MMLANGAKLWGLLAAGTLLMRAAPAAAHHSGIMFEPTKTVTVTGVVKTFQYTNPHSWLFVDVRAPDGSVQTWGFEAEGPSTLMRAGITSSSLKPGTKVTVTARPMKDGRPAGAWVKLVTADGKVLDPHATQ
ncbi:MAG TPA: DUF6152 family protein [Gammaproteobacteria bacterium]|nr:DUF6152 family protein [Gammaproteobacteria bacterium]